MPSGWKEAIPLLLGHGTASLGTLSVRDVINKSCSLKWCSLKWEIAAHPMWFSWPKNRGNWCFSTWIWHQQCPFGQRRLGPVTDIPSITTQPSLNQPTNGKSIYEQRLVAPGPSCERSGPVAWKEDPRMVICVYKEIHVWYISICIYIYICMYT